MNAAELTAASEGKRYQCYDDATGKPLLEGDACTGTPTIGRGHTGPEVIPGLVWTDDQINQAFARDMRTALATAAVALGTQYWCDLNQPRRDALTDMAFNLGARRLAGFAHMLAAIRVKDWQRAHDEALASAWAGQVGQRAVRDATILLTGEWPAGA